MLINNYELNVLVKGKPITEYYHNGQMFIEGRDGSNFEIEFINRTNTQVEAVISVDGLSVIDGKAAGIASSGYVVEGNGRVRIPGWKLTDEQVAAFVFSGKKNSYASQSTGSSANNGVLGVMVFKQKNDLPYFSNKLTRAMPLTKSYMSVGHSNAKSVGSYPWHGQYSKTLGSGSSLGQSLNNQATTSASTGWETFGATANTTKIAPKKSIEVTKTETVNNLGTGFGEATEFETSTVTFSRGDLGGMLIMYYDNAGGLKKRGIELTRSYKEKETPIPQAFPAMNGCTPPPGWKG